jgi:signal peptidase I
MRVGEALAKLSARVYASAAMLSYFAPRYVKQGRAFLKDARKLLAYKRDLWSPAAVEHFEGGIRRLEGALRERNQERAKEAAADLDRQAGEVVKPLPDAGWRENCEVFLVAIVIALAVRTYFLQPFTIPTGSMQPTLNGIIGYPTQEPPPNLAVRLFQKAWYGRTWIDVKALADEQFLDVREVKRFGVFTRTQLRGTGGTYTINCPKDPFERYFLGPMRSYKAGEIIARGYYDTGDHVFVDKLTYHFRHPRRDEVFVFNTQNVATRENRATGMTGPSQFYIKRLVGVPNDLLQIRPPELLINGQRGEGSGMQKVMSLQNGFRGYSNESEQLDYQGKARRFRMNHLSSPEEQVRVPADYYWAMGDNSFHSSDSRDWGPVPEKNVMGRGVFVYWPFGRHWGFIR